MVLVCIKAYLVVKKHNECAAEPLTNLLFALTVVVPFTHSEPNSELLSRRTIIVTINSKVFRRYTLELIIVAPYFYSGCLVNWKR